MLAGAPRYSSAWVDYSAKAMYNTIISMLAHLDHERGALKAVLLERRGQLRSDRFELSHRHRLRESGLVDRFLCEIRTIYKIRYT
jgi:hypothetical protein